MTGEKFRYFIELQPSYSESLPRFRETEIRRQMAETFIRSLREWLRDCGMEAKVSAISPTAFGQIQITCESDVINLIRDQDVMHIAAIRGQAAMLGQRTEVKFY